MESPDRHEAVKQVAHSVADLLRAIANVIHRRALRRLANQPKKRKGRTPRIGGVPVYKYDGKLHPERKP